MKAQMQMKMDTTFGNTAVLTIEAELDNPHERTNNLLLRDMANMLANGVKQIRMQSEAALALNQQAEHPEDSEASQSMRASWEQEGRGDE